MTASGGCRDWITGRLYSEGRYIFARLGIEEGEELALRRRWHLGQSGHNRSDWVWVTTPVCCVTLEGASHILTYFWEVSLIINDKFSFTIGSSKLPGQSTDTYSFLLQKLAHHFWYMVQWSCWNIQDSSLPSPAPLFSVTPWYYTNLIILFTGCSRPTP